MTQLNPIDHPAGNDENDVSFTVSYMVTDGDKDTATGSLTINVDDDTPGTIGAIQNAMLPTIPGAEVHGTWQPAGFGADGPSESNGIIVSMGGTSPSGLTYVQGADLGPNVNGEEVYRIDVKSGATTLYSFYEYSHYDSATQTTTMFAYGNETDALNATGSNEFFTLAVAADGTYDFDLVSTTGLPSTQNFNLTAKANSGSGGYLIFNGTTATYGGQHANDPSSGYDILIDGWTGDAFHPSPNSHTVHGNANGFGVDSGNFDTGQTMMFKFAPGQEQSAMTISVGKGNNATNEHFIVTIWNADHTQYATEEVILPDGATVHIDAAHWGTGNGYTNASDPFFKFSEVNITNVAVAANDEDVKVTLTGFSADEKTTISDTELNFAITQTDGDGDQVTSGSDSLLVTLDGTHTGGGYQLTGTNSNPEVFAATANVDTISGGTGTGDTVDYSGSPTHGVTVDLTLTTQATVAGSWSSGDKLSGIENLLGTDFTDFLLGNASANTLVGGDGNDMLTGRGGADILTGGAGDDTFRYLATADSTVAAHDVITDFGNGSDVIDLTAISGITNDAVYSATTPTTVAAHSVVYFQNGADTVIYANASNATENAANADMMLVLTGVDASTLNAGSIHQ